jgi:hypothetical protein
MTRPGRLQSNGDELIGNDARSSESGRRFLIGGAALTSVALGIAIGLVIAWGVWPVQYANADPVDLRQSCKDDYIRMISVAYQMDGDIIAAKQRLSQLGLSDPVQAINDLISRDNVSSGNPDDLDALTSLALALSANSQVPTPQPTLLPGETPQTIVVVETPTEQVSSFALVEQTPLSCTDEPDAPHLQIIVRDASGRDLPNVGIQIRWAGGDETIYTGLKPERGLGYADFEATPGTFSVTLVNAQSDTASDLLIDEAPANCKIDHGTTPRGWKLVFQQK